jgi:4-hydroxymandelate oxidase
VDGPTPVGTGRWLDSLRDRASRAMHPAVWSYVESGSYGQLSVAEATEAWRELRFRPRVLQGHTSPALGTTLLGTPFATPVAVAPTAMQRAVHPLGERAMSEGASAAGSLYVVSTNSGTRFDRLTAGPWWLQVYLPATRDAFLPVLEAAVAAGARAVVLTVDTPFPGTKYAAETADWTGVDVSWWRANFPEPRAEGWAHDLVPADLTWLRERAGVPLVVKGVLRGDDAARCLDAGADAIYVSNHGGRQLDRTVSTARALLDVVQVVGDRAEVYVDGGIRSGLDVLGALALGARAVLVGRPALHALALDGARGVEQLLTALTEELREGLALAGCATPYDAPSVLDS